MPFVRVSNGGTLEFTTLLSLGSTSTYTITSKHKAIIVFGRGWGSGSKGTISCTNATRVLYQGPVEASGTSVYEQYSVYSDFTSDTATVSFTGNRGMGIIAVD